MNATTWAAAGRPLNRIVEDDVLTALRAIPDGLFRGVVTSPPYNLGGIRGVEGSKWRTPGLDGGYDGHADDMPHGEYVAWQRAVLDECMRVTAPDGAIFYVHKPRIREGLLHEHHDILNGYPLRQKVIWARAGGHNFAPTHFVPTYEVVHLIAKPDFRLSPGANSLKDVWAITQDGCENEHPAPFPVEVAANCIQGLGTGPVLDPFMGSGTTALAAREAGIDWLGIEHARKYNDMATARLARAA